MLDGTRELLRAVTQNSKKERERRELRYVYDESRFDSVVPSECPDFVIHRRHGEGLFGVEVIEVYSSHPGYSGDIVPISDLDGNRRKKELLRTKERF